MYMRASVHGGGSCELASPTRTHTALAWAYAAMIYTSVHRLKVQDKRRPTVHSTPRLNASAHPCCSWRFNVTTASVRRQSETHQRVSSKIPAAKSFPPSHLPPFDVVLSSDFSKVPLQWPMWNNFKCHSREKAAKRHSRTKQRHGKVELEGTQRSVLSSTVNSEGFFVVLGGCAVWFDCRR